MRFLTLKIAVFLTAVVAVAFVFDITAYPARGTLTDMASPSLLGRTELTDATGTISVSGLDTAEHLAVRIFLKTLSTNAVFLRFNSDAGAVYSYTVFNQAGGVIANLAGQNEIRLTGFNPAAGRELLILMQAENQDGENKLAKWNAGYQPATSATFIYGGGAARHEVPAGQITSLDVFSSGGGNFDVGSYVAVYGTDV